MASGGGLMSMTVAGPAFAAQLDKAGDKVVDAAKSAITVEAESIITDSVPLVPWKIGTLRDSHFVNDPEETDDTIEVTFGYGGEAEAYALKQHEHEEYVHPKGGQAKYLLNAIESHESDLDERLAGHTKRFLARGSEG